LVPGAINARRATGRTSELEVTDTVESDTGDTGDAAPPADLRGVCPDAPSSPGAGPDRAEYCAISALEARVLFGRPVGGPWICWGEKENDVGLVGDAGIGLRLVGVRGVRGVVGVWGAKREVVFPVSLESSDKLEEAADSTGDGTTLIHRT
jgi:hypothetical protein